MMSLASAKEKTADDYKRFLLCVSTSASSKGFTAREGSVLRFNLSDRSDAAARRGLSVITETGESVSLGRTVLPCGLGNPEGNVCSIASGDSRIDFA